MVFLITVAAGFLNGCFHALTGLLISNIACLLDVMPISSKILLIAGPDHLAALLPSIFGKRWYFSCSLGLIWGCGHGIAAALMGIFFYFLRDTILSDDVSKSVGIFADYVVGFTLIIIGWIGLAESFSLNSNEISHSEYEIHADSDSFSPSTGRVNIPFFGELHFKEKLSMFKYFPKCSLLLATLVNGFMLGFSLDGLPSLTPALGTTTLIELGIFLFNYWLGTSLAMSISCGIIGECTCWLGKSTNEKLPVTMAVISSILAGCIGLFWIGQTTLRISRIFASQ